MQNVRVCPRCGSTDVGHDTTSVISRLSLSDSLECRECGYTGIFPEVDPESLEDFRDNLEEVEEEDVERSGRNRRGRIVIGVLLLLLGLGASSYATWGNGLLAGLLAIAVGASVLFGEMTRV